MHAVITAGGRVGPAFARAIGTDVKALAPMGSRRLIDGAVDAARGAGASAIAVVGPPGVLAHCGSRIDRGIIAADDGTENIRRALHAFEDFERLVFLTSDLPFIDAAGLQTFVDDSGDAALTMALTPADTYAAAFPGAPPHAVALRGERYANGSVFTLTRAVREPLEAAAGRFFQARKSLVRLALLLGPVLCARYAMRRLRVRDIERRAATVLGAQVRAVRDAAPGLCFDIDDLPDWAYAQSLAAMRG